MRTRCLPMLAAALAVTCSVVHAEARLPAGLTALLLTPEHRSALLAAAKEEEGPGLPTCPGATYVTTGDLGLLDPVRADAAGRIVAGAWKESIQQSGCGTARLLNALTTVQPDGTLQTEPLLPGTTITDPQLQQDSVQYAAGAMGELPQDCDQGGVWDTRFLGVEGRPPGKPPQPNSPPRPWTEVWTLIACSKRAKVTMHFTPDATGTEIRADPASP